MKFFEYFIIFIGIAFLIETWFFINRDKTIDKFDSVLNKPSVLIVSLIRNKAHTLPIFLTYLQEQDYPKNKISLWLMTDHNEDNSREILETWLNETKELYRSVHYHFDDGEKLRSDERDKLHWSSKRMEDLINMKEAAFEFARNSSVDYVFFVDADVFLTNSSTLYALVSLNLPIVAPMLIAEGLIYSNFWCGMTSNYDYKDTKNYYTIGYHEEVGEFPVPMVHSAVLIDIRAGMNKFLTFNKTKLNSFYKRTKYNGPVNDIITFAISSLFSKSRMFISNSHHYGFILSHLEEDDEFFLTILTKAAIVNLHGKVNILPFFKKFVSYPEKSRLTFSEIYMINLKRRPERRLKKEAVFQELGIDCTFIEAVDGRELTEQILVDKGIKILPNYEDWYDGRYLTMGEVGCFLSHYKIWERIVKEQQQEVLIFEDDIKLHYKFTSKISWAMEEARRIGGYDLIYIHRQPLYPSLESFLPNSNTFVKVEYSFNADAYVLTLKGAEKLLAAKPLEKLLPVDHFLPIMYDSYNIHEWMAYFEKRDLIAWSVSEFLASPSHSRDDVDYTSDTRFEGSTIVRKELIESVNFTNNSGEL